MAGASAIRVFLVDSRPLVLDGLAGLIDARKPAMEVVGQATNYAHAIELAQRLAPDVILFSFFRDGMDGLQALSTLLGRPQAKVMLLKGLDEAAPVGKAIELGACGVVFAEDPTESIVHAIVQAAHATSGSGKAWVGGLARLAARTRSQRDAERGKPAKLTSRELELIEAIVNDPAAKYIVIGARLGISEHTVHNHLSSIYQKLELLNRADLLVYVATHRIGTRADPARSGWVDLQ